MTEELTISNPTTQNLQSKELLYSLFYELTSEIKGKKIKIDEDVYQENIRITTIPQLVSYIRNTIQLLIKKKIQETKSTVYPKPTEVTDDERSQYESSLWKLEAYQRSQIKHHFEQKLKNEAIDNRMNELIEIEEEFEDMKTKLKFDEGKFLDNDRKDNEILIIRAENTNLKKTIGQLEHHSKILEVFNAEKDKLISQNKEEIIIIQAKLEKTQKELNLFSNINININNNNNNPVIASNNSNTNIDNNISNINNNTPQFSSKEKCLYCTCSNSSSNFHTKGIEKQVTILNIKNIKEIGHKTKTDGISSSIGQIAIANDATIKSKKKGHQRNNSMNMLLDKKKINLISKYFSHQQKIPIKQMQQSGSCKKITQMPMNSIKKSCTNRTSQLSQFNHNKQKQKALKNQQNASHKSSVSYGSISKADL